MPDLPAADTLGKIKRHFLGVPDGTPAEHTLPIKAICGPLTYDGRHVRIWYRLHPTRWSFRTAKEQEEAVLNPQMVAYAALAGRSLHRVRHPRDVSIAAWGQRYDVSLPAVPNRPAFEEQLTRTMTWLGGRPRSRPVTYLGIEVVSRTVLDKAYEALAKKSPGKEQRAIQAALREVEEAAALLGEPCTGAEVAELVHRSVGLGLPAPIDVLTGDVYTGSDLLEFTDGITTSPHPGGRAFRVDGDRLRNGAPTERWVSILALGRVEDIEIPGPHYPWIAYGDRLPFPVLWSEHVTVYSPSDARPEIEDKIKVVADQRSQYRKHPDIDVPPDLDLTDRKAKEIRVELAQGHPVTSCRVRGHVYAAVIGLTEEEALDRAERFVLHYRNQQQQSHRVRAQAAHAAAFQPGGAPPSESHTRRMKLGYWTAALPTIEARLGDGEGMALGHTDGTIKEPVFWSPHKSIVEGEMTGLMPIIGGLGAGKSTIAADVVHEGVLAGQQWTVNDPAGSLRGMVTLPEFRGLAYHLDLARAEPGIGSPFALIPEPREADFPAAEDYLRAAVTARSARKTLALDLLRGALPPDIGYSGQTEALLRKALRATGGLPTTSCEEIIPILEKSGQNGKDIAEALLDAAEHPSVALFWPAGDPAEALTDYRLLVVSLTGWTMPASTDRREWSVEERMSVLGALISAYVAGKRVYEAPEEDPKGYFQDESHILDLWASGRAFSAQLERNSRRRRLRALMASHNGEEFTRNGMANRINEVIVGHTEDPAAQRAALALLRVQPNAGYEATLARLSPLDAQGRRPPFRRYAMRDASGNVEVFRTDMRHKPHLLAAISPKDKQAAWGRVVDLDKRARASA